MAFSNSVQDLSADTAAFLSLSADVADIGLLRGVHSTDIHALQFGVVSIPVVADSVGLSSMIVHGIGYAPQALAIVAGRSTYFPYVWINDGVNIQFGVRHFQNTVATLDVAIYYLLIG